MWKIVFDVNEKCEIQSELFQLRFLIHALIFNLIILALGSSVKVMFLMKISIQSSNECELDCLRGRKF